MDEEYQEEANWNLCFEAAAKVGFSKKQAEDCNAGSLKCSSCPFKGYESQIKKRQKQNKEVVGIPPLDSSRGGMPTRL
jgi:hypothetical protein